MKFIESFFHFFKLLFIENKVDIIFYYPQHFNRGEKGENLFFEPLYQACKRNNISYLVFEEIDSNSDKPRDKDAIPFDFIFYIILILRKLKITDISTGRLLSKTFLRRLKFTNFIVLSQSMLEVFRGVNENAKLFDLQHGIIHSSKRNYIEDNHVSDRISGNKIKLLLSGFGYKNILSDADKTNYLKDNSHIIGVSKMNSETFHSCSNKNILVTLQFTADHTKIQNDKLLTELDGFIDANSEYTFYLKSHPRFNNEVDLKSLADKKNTKIASSQLEHCFQLCSIHLTAYSTTVFECASVGLPTIFLTSLQNDFNMFNKDFKYPLKNDLEYIENNYSEYSALVKIWESVFYTDFDENKFISLLK